MDYMRGLKKIEHAFTTHMLRRYCWVATDGAKGRTLAHWLKDCDRVGRSLLRWTTGLSEALETIILTVPLRRDMVQDVVYACPQLKHLVANMIVEGFGEQSKVQRKHTLFLTAFEAYSVKDLSRTNLETLIISAFCKVRYSDCWVDEEHIFEIELPGNLSVLCLADSPTYIRKNHTPVTRLFSACPKSSMWDNLIALEWITPDDANLNSDDLLAMPLK